ncbi:hypothetical protein H5394_16915 [Paracoccus sp. MC1862]|nr:hypothetical protein [Paracoccus sp. MC1854]MBB1493299.1 hypothetical protein [Paracoccus sp. MC1854]MBB1499756.1 hypothetical protein [Paracoccus sp. MC1862]QQO45764.1 hypothetical protein JGR78_05390 [Paracoccus sp. MC1862]
MVIAPPSKKPDGSAYEWVNPMFSLSIADALGWLLDLLKNHEASRNARTHVERRAE